MSKTVMTSRFAAGLLGVLISASASLAQDRSETPLFSIDFSDYQPGSDSIRD
jgi:hypothetical protein